jgi:hypothetical protein
MNDSTVDIVALVVAVTAAFVANLTQYAAYLGARVPCMLIPKFGKYDLANILAKVSSGPDGHCAILQAELYKKVKWAGKTIRLVLRSTPPPQPLEEFVPSAAAIAIDEDALKFLYHFFPMVKFFHDGPETAFCVRAADLVPGQPGYVSVTLITSMTRKAEQATFADKIAAEKKETREQKRAAIQAAVDKHRLEARMARMHLHGFDSLDAMDKAEAEERAQQAAEEERRRKAAEEERRRVAEAARQEREAEERAKKAAQEAAKAMESKVQQAAKVAAKLQAQQDKFGKKRGASSSPPPSGGA